MLLTKVKQFSYKKEINGCPESEISNSNFSILHGNLAQIAKK